MALIWWVCLLEAQLHANSFHLRAYMYSMLGSVADYLSYLLRLSDERFQNQQLFGKFIRMQLQKKWTNEKMHRSQWNQFGSTQTLLCKFHNWTMIS